MRKFRFHLILALGAALLWLLQFYLFPVLAPQFYPQTNEATLLLVLPPLIISIMGSWFFETMPSQWLPADILYAVLMAISNQEGLYGIGLRGALLAGSTTTYSSGLAALCSAAVFLGLLMTQVTTYGAKVLSKR